LSSPFQAILSKLAASARRHNGRPYNQLVQNGERREDESLPAPRDILSWNDLPRSKIREDLTLKMPAKLLI
jgi:hypothetical protein